MNMTGRVQGSVRGRVDSKSDQVSYSDDLCPVLLCSVLFFIIRIDRTGQLRKHFRLIST